MNMITRKKAPVIAFDDFFNSFFNLETDVVESDVIEKEFGWTIEFILPGYKKNDLKISVEDDVLTVSYEVKDEDKFSKRIKPFSKSYKLPANVDLDKIKASMEDGILKIDIYKLENELKKNKIIVVE